MHIDLSHIQNSVKKSQEILLVKRGHILNKGGGPSRGSLSVPQLNSCFATLFKVLLELSEILFTRTSSFKSVSLITFWLQSKVVRAFRIPKIYKRKTNKTSRAKGYQLYTHKFLARSVNNSSGKLWSMMNFLGIHYFIELNHL